MTTQPSRSLVSASAVMAVGTVFSRASGYVRSALLLAALGTQMHADAFNIANTIPNMLYVLLAGGMFNAVLVPQLVRAMRHDGDDGAAYTNRIITLAALFLLAVSVILVLAAPLLLRWFLDGEWFAPENTEVRESAVTFARYCLPQVFFYGMFVLVGQVLNARERFAPMMWAPISNNVIAILVLITYMTVHGPAKDLNGGFTPGQEALLGLGSTLGIVVQLLVLIPFLRATGFRFRPRFDFRNAGINHTLRLGFWAVLTVAINQVAYSVVVRIASSGTAGAEGGTGYTIYSMTYLIAIVPHAVITVSIATAALPRLSQLAADEDLRGVGSEVLMTMRTTLALIVPFALLLPVVALPIATIVSKYGAAADSTDDFARSLSLFAFGLVFFTGQFLLLRGFFALERTRTVFWIQCVISTCDIVFAVLLTRGVAAADVAPRLVIAYGLSYVVGATLSYFVFRRVTGGLDSLELVRFGVRILLVGGLTALACLGVRELLISAWGPTENQARALVDLAILGVVGLIGLFGLARVFRLEELRAIVRIFGTRLGRR